MSSAIPFQELTLDAIRNAKVRAKARGYDLMLKSGRGESSQQITPRDVRANLDLGLSVGTDTDEFVMAAGTAGTNLAVINNAMGANKFLIIYGIAIVSPAVRPHIIVVDFKTGPGGANTKASVDLQRGYAYNVWSWYLDDPVLYGPSETVYIVTHNAVSWAVGDFTFVISGYVFEPAGQTVA